MIMISIIFTFKFNQYILPLFEFENKLYYSIFYYYHHLQNQNITAAQSGNLQHLLLRMYIYYSKLECIYIIVNCRNYNK